MIDIIIPVYNASDTLPLTLMSIYLQEVSCKYKVTIIDDCSEENYDNTINYYREYLNINYKKLEKNSGSGIARQIGIDITNNPYIVFIDADDLFYNIDSLEELYSNIQKGFDVVLGSEFDEFSKTTRISEGNLHGKIYRRKYIIDNNIKFNETRFHEDNYFNNFVLLTGANKLDLDKVVYIYSNNVKSITKVDSDKEFARLEILLSNVNELFKRIKISNNNINRIKHFLFIKYRYYNEIYTSFSEKQKKIFKSWINKYDKNNISLIGIRNVNELEKAIDQIYCE